MMARGGRDLLVMLGAAAAAIIVGALLRFMLPPRWEGVLGVGMLFAAYAVVKWRQPANTFVRGVTWLHLALVVVIAELIVLLLSDFSILGYWTIPASICLGLTYCVAHLFLVGDDGRRRSR